MTINIAIVDDKNWDHKEDNCKLCGTAQREEPLDTPSPGQVKRKEISTHNTPQANKALQTKSGSARPLFQKETPVVVDDEIETSVRKDKVSHIASENEVVEVQHVTDENLGEVKHVTDENLGEVLSVLFVIGFQGSLYSWTGVDTTVTESV